MPLAMHAALPLAEATDALGAPLAPGGIAIQSATSQDALAELRLLLNDAFAGLAPLKALHWQTGSNTLVLRLPLAIQQQIAPGHDTLPLRQRLALDAGPPSRSFLPGSDTAEIAAALLLGPQLHEFPSVAEFASALRVRANVARAAAQTMLNFDTEAVERPWALWRYDEARGFHLQEGASLIDALRSATQPAVSGHRYAFSCYRATEYVLLLGLAEELQYANPPLYARLQTLWQQRAIVSAEFHEVFLRETGSQAAPLPPRYYVPGDRVWFRNPDEASADAAGFEGSWVIYQGGGHFCNFWEAGRPFDLEGKCLEVYHWRDGLYHDDQGHARIDEGRVASAVAHTRQSAAATARILSRMQRYRDGRGVYAEGGCIDSTREQLRWLCPGTTDLALPTD